MKHVKIKDLLPGDLVACYMGYFSFWMFLSKSSYDEKYIKVYWLMSYRTSGISFYEEIVSEHANVEIVND